MKVLAIETSTMAASCAIVDENKVHAEFYTDFKLKHSEKILPLVEGTLQSLRMNINDIDLFSVGNGPGSFTGLRIASSTIRAFAQATNKKVACISTLGACAYQNSLFPGIIVPILDAQRDAVYTAQFKMRDGDFIRLQEDSAVALEVLEEDLKPFEKVLFCGDAVMKFQDQIIRDMGNRALFADCMHRMPKASCVGMLALEKMKKGDVNSYDDFLPNYIRKVQAETEKARAGK